MKNIIELIIIWPFVAFVISLFLPKRNEKIVSVFAFSAVTFHLVVNIVWLISWILRGANPVNIVEFSIFKSDHFNFFIDFYYDLSTAVFTVTGSFLIFLVTYYSRVYLHRESGYKRYFNTILIFYFGYTLTVFAGNLETLFAGWEVLGLTSFLLVAFYRDRYLPVKNAFKVFSIYRIGDVGIILAMWASHHLWHENITFSKLLNAQLVHEHLEGHTLFGVFISLMLLTAASAKSAQFPYTFWLPRAMEGPTPSSAIFYGSLSVHLGLLLMIKTMPFWEDQTIARIAIGLTGLITALISSSTGRVQSSVKSQIAYASAAQIGLMFIEISFGWKTLALIHFAGNAFLRTYQLLVSPSVVSYLIRQQFYSFESKHENIETHFSKKLEYTLFLLSIKEWNMDLLLDKFLWKPFKNLGNYLRFINATNIFLFTIPALIFGLYLKVYNEKLPSFLSAILPEVFALIGLLLVFRAYAGRKYVYVVWSLLIMNHLWILLAISFNEALSIEEIIFYLAGVVLAGVSGFVVLFLLKKHEPDTDLNSYQGFVTGYPKLAAFFLFSCLGLAGFPITSTFIGEDLLFSHIHYNQLFLAFFMALGYVVSGIAAIRMYARIFLGPYVKKDHVKALRSS